MACGETFDGSILAILQEICSTANLEGVAVLDLGPDAAENPVLFNVGLSGPTTIASGRLLLTGQPARPTHLTGKDGRPLLACPWVLPPNHPGGLLLWRAPHAPAWAQADHSLASAVALLVRTTITSGVGQIGIDRLTGVPNRRWFVEEADRRVDRLDHDGAVASLLLIDIDNLRRVNANVGREHGNRILVRLATQLRAMVRPSDLVARVGPDEFAVWQDGMDHLTAAERADALCTGDQLRGSPEDVKVTLSIGIATRQPGGSDDVRSMLRRAHMAARDVKLRGGGSWCVSRPDPLPGCSGQTE